MFKKISLKDFNKENRCDLDNDNDLDLIVSKLETHGLHTHYISFNEFDVLDAVNEDKGSVIVELYNIIDLDVFISIYY